MSEQNIWNGTYVLGDTSATTIIAGDGIKVDSSVPGTIRISNDETVIWTQDGNFDGPGKTLTFSEPASAFEKLEFRCGVDVQNKECVTIEYHPGNAVVAWHEYYTNQFRQFYSLLSINDSGATAVSGCPYFANLAQNATFTGQTVNWTWCFKAITAIRGIGRRQ